MADHCPTNDHLSTAVEHVLPLIFCVMHVCCACLVPSQLLCLLPTTLSVPWNVPCYSTLPTAMTCLVLRRALTLGIKAALLEQILRRLREFQSDFHTADSETACILMFTVMSTQAFMVRRKLRHC